MIAVINTEGSWLNRIEIPSYPEIISLAFSQLDSNCLMAIDKSTHTVLFEFEVKEAALEKSEKDKASQYYG